LRYQSVNPTRSPGGISVAQPGAVTRPTLNATLAVLALSGASVPAAYAQWAPPIGIPAPSFGIVETARPAPNPWVLPTPGFYYVDATQPTATDTANTFGTPGRPRQTIPTALPAGAVVELHGIYDASHSSPRTIVASGNGALAQNVVIYDVSIHDNGDINATFDQDVHGIAVSGLVDHLWVVDSQLFRNSGDGIQLNAGDIAHQPTLHHVYVGRTTAYS